MSKIRLIFLVFCVLFCGCEDRMIYSAVHDISYNGPYIAIDVEYNVDTYRVVIPNYQLNSILSLHRNIREDEYVRLILDRLDSGLPLSVSGPEMEALRGDVFEASRELDQRQTDNAMEMYFEGVILKRDIEPGNILQVIDYLFRRGVFICVDDESGYLRKCYTGLAE